MAAKRKRLTKHEKLMLEIEELKKDPKFRKAIKEFIDASTNRVYKLNFKLK